MIKVEGLVKSVQDRVILKDLNFTLKQGEIAVILGRSGIGKTVFIKTVAGLLPYEKGIVEVDGMRVNPYNYTDMKIIWSKIGFVFQYGALLDSLSTIENIGFGLKENGFKEKEWKRIAFEKLEAVGLDKSVAGLMPAQLSGGMKKMVSLARALALSPNYLFYDEPTAGLDYSMVVRITSLIGNINKILGIASLIITHDLYLAKKFRENIYFLKDGRLVKPPKKVTLEDFYDE